MEEIDIYLIIADSLAKDLEANDVGKYPFLMKDWNVEKTTSQTTTHRPTLYTAITSSENDIYAGSKASKREEKSDDIDGLTLLFLILPALLCGIWIILVIVVIAVCCRKKRQSGGDSNHPFDGMWKAPPRRAMAAISSSLAATSHYGPRIRPYEGY
uniref:Conserved plasma membrane protein n=1 Tax=Heterorhabditis bacteriophora TaxID=37862 RepID=A0A1I7XKE7_HETBA